MIEYMLDTDISIYVINRRPFSILHRFNEHADSLCISAISLAELCRGAKKSNNPTAAASRVEDFVSRLTVLEYGTRAAEHYGDVKTKLEREGMIIGPNDLHIAGHARSESLVLVTNSTREFGRVEGLRVENWRH
ncbi:MAG: PIN domain-containing protein [Gammaproteobacteria bacterium]|nr:PIN domain-containing protein [Gammaproteobacteria bacterium]MCY4200485.1 PIN domain-containing protein [Gammaproteobacteria bacterium]MCY4323273.1 PIN domain-containing protein [Gammaproteobacteria bacterium]